MAQRPQAQGRGLCFSCPPWSPRSFCFLPGAALWEGKRGLCWLRQRIGQVQLKNRRALFTSLYLGSTSCLPWRNTQRQEKGSLAPGLSPVTSLLLGTVGKPCALLAPFLSLQSWGWSLCSLRATGFCLTLPSSLHLSCPLQLQGGREGGWAAGPHGKQGQVMIPQPFCREFQNTGSDLAVMKAASTMLSSLQRVVTASAIPLDPGSHPLRQ